MRPAALVTGILTAVIATGCGWVSAGPRPHLGVENGTTLDVALFVNNVEVAVVRRGGPLPAIDATRLPPFPWTVEARTALGGVLTTMQVVPGQVWTTTRPDGGISSSGAMGRVDLSCGRLTIWAGDAAPLGPPPNPESGEPGDCAP